MIGERGRRRWRAFWWDADGKHSRVLGPAWVQSSGKRSARGAIVWHAGDGAKPDASYLTPREAERVLRGLLEHEAVRQPSVRNARGAPVTFADAAAAWLEHGERRRNLKRSTLKDYRQVIGAYLVEPGDGERESSVTAYGYAPFARTALRELRPNDIKGWYDELPYGRTSEKLLMVVRAILAHARSRAWIELSPAAAVERQQVRYSGDYDFYGREEIDALVSHAGSDQDAAIYLTAAMTGLRRGELIALRWRDVDFAGQSIRVRANYSFGELVTPKSRKIRTVPMIPDVAQA
ncbi:MAG: tyrosine-type recombinase/integrase, partial [Solirubrobacteraceae bacterium]